MNINNIGLNGEDLSLLKKIISKDARRNLSSMLPLLILATLVSLAVYLMLGTFSGRDFSIGGFAHFVFAKFEAWNMPEFQDLDSRILLCIMEIIFRLPQLVTLCLIAYCSYQALRPRIGSSYSLQKLIDLKRDLEAEERAIKVTKEDIETAWKKLSKLMVDHDVSLSELEQLKAKVSKMDFLSKEELVALKEARSLEHSLSEKQFAKDGSSLLGRLIKNLRAEHLKDESTVTD